MKQCVWPVMTALLLGAATEAQGHFPILRTGYGFGGGGVISFGKYRRSGYFQLSIGRSRGGWYPNPYFYPTGVSRGFTQIEIITPPPQPIIVQQAPVFPLPPPQGVDWDRELIEQLFPERRRPPAVVPMPAIPPRKKPKPPLPPPPKPDVKPPVQKKDPPKAVPHLPARKAPEIIPRNEKERLIFLGRGAFANQQYGLAAEHFRRAVDQAPRNAEVHLLLAQAQFALSRYRLAHEEILTGLRLAPDWPAGDFRPLDLYGEHVLDYAADQMALENVLADHPDDSLLLFLYAYHLWFDGRKVEALPLIERLLPTFPDKDILERFLKALPDAPVM